MNQQHDIPTDFDIAICGAGPVGLCLAVLLVQHGFAAAKIALIDAKTLAQASTDPRSIALSCGSQQLLQQAGVWPLPAMAIHQIHVSRRGRFGRTLIDRADYAVPALGYVSRYGAMVTALGQRAQQLGITALRPAKIETSTEQIDAVQITLADQRQIRSQVLVQAEGGVFGAQRIADQHRDYRQVALVAEVTVSAPLAHRAFERFTEQGPLALLPRLNASNATASNSYALVWCLRPGAAEQILQLPDAEFLRQLEHTFGSRLGHFISSTRRHAFPLGLNAQADVSARSVTIGNAAQTLHPVAGQGLNLGLRDAAVLAPMLAQTSFTANTDLSATLAKFVQSRRADRHATIRITDTMARIFASAPDTACSQSLLGASFCVLDLFQPARRVLAEQMMFGRR